MTFPGELNIPCLSKLEVVDYLRALAAWIEDGDVIVPEVAVKTWPNIGTVHIDLKVRPLL